MILVVVDVQAGLDDPQYGERSTPRCEEHVAALLDAWRGASLPVLFTRHLSRRPGSPLAETDPRSCIKPGVGPREGEPVFAKSTNSAFKSPAFAAAVARAGEGGLVIAGMTTDACVTATAREAHDLGYPVTVVGDACAAFARLAPDGRRYPARVVHEVALAALAASGIGVRAAAEVLREVAPGGTAPGA